MVLATNHTVGESFSQILNSLGYPDDLTRLSTEKRQETNRRRIKRGSSKHFQWRPVGAPFRLFPWRAGRQHHRRLRYHRYRTRWQYRWRWRCLYPDAADHQEY